MDVVCRSKCHRVVSQVSCEMGIGRFSRTKLPPSLRTRMRSSNQMYDSKEDGGGISATYID